MTVDIGQAIEILTILAFFIRNEHRMTKVETLLTQHLEKDHGYARRYGKQQT